MLVRARIQFHFCLIIYLLCASCSMWVPARVKNHFTICYQGQSTGLDSLINLDGTYETSLIWWNRSGYGKTFNPRLDTSRIDMILLKDGIALSMLCNSVRREALNTPTDLSAAPEPCAQLAEPCAQLEGIFQVVNDTIKLQLTTDNRWGWADWHTEETWFKITSRNTLQYLGYYSPRTGFKRFEPDSLNQKVYTFHPTKTLPSSKDIWLTKQEWFRCGEKITRRGLYRKQLGD